MPPTGAYAHESRVPFIVVSMRVEEQAIILGAQGIFRGGGRGGVRGAASSGIISLSNQSMQSVVPYHSIMACCTQEYQDPPGCTMPQYRCYCSRQLLDGTHTSSEVCSLRGELHPSLTSGYAQRGVGYISPSPLGMLRGELVTSLPHLWVCSSVTWGMRS